MQSWMERLGLMLAILAMLLVVSVPVAVANDDKWDDGRWDSHEWVGDDEDDEEFDEEFDEWFDEEFTVFAEVECEPEGIDWDGDGWDDEFVIVYECEWDD